MEVSEFEHIPSLSFHCTVCIGQMAEGQVSFVLDSMNSFLDQVDSMNSFLDQVESINSFLDQGDSMIILD